MNSISRAARMASAFFAFAVATSAGAASAPSPTYEFVHVDETTEVKALARPADKAAPFATQAPASSPPFAKLGQVYAGETEPNDAATTASPLVFTNQVVRGNLFPNGDVDFYAFTANAGDRVYAATMTSFSAGSSTDSQLSLLASDGITVIEFDDDNGSFAGLSSSIAGATIPSAGTYFIKVNDFTAGTTSERGYELHFRLQSGAPTPEVEANDTPATANPLPANGWVSGTRNPAAATEQDWFSLNLNAGDTVYLALDVDPERDGTLWNGRLGFALFGDASNQILVVDDAGTGDVAPLPNIPSEAMFFTVKTAGTYFAFVDSASASVGGATSTYHLSVSVHPAGNEGVNCTTYMSTDVPKTIGPGNGLVSSTLTIPGNPRIADLDVELVLNHVLMQDIDAHLRSPAGNDNGLFTDIGSAALGGQSQMDIVFDDEAGIPPAFTVMRNIQIKPEVAYRLGWFDGENAGGVWTLDLYDDTAGGNGGTLTSWGLRVCEVPPPPACPPGFGLETVYSTDFESGAAGFTHAGTADEWELGLPATVATNTVNPIAAFNTCNSGVNCWKTDLDNTYEIDSSQDLLSPAINLAGLSAPVVVTWAQRYQMETANVDHAFIEARQVGGATPVRLFDWMDGTMTDAPGNPAFSIGASSGWSVRSVRADALAGLNSELLFHLDSNNATNFGGLAIDDVSVTACRLLNADLSITKTDSTATATPGSSVTYTITAANAGPDPVTGATVADTFPASLTCNSTCVGAGGGTCAVAPIAGNINDTVDLPVGASVTYSATCTVSAAATGTLSNTATVSSAVNDSNPANNSATDTDTLTPQSNLGIVKTDSVLAAVPGESVTYTITASNAGPSNAPGATVADTFPADLTCNWTCSALGGGTCTAGPVVGNINDVVNLPVGGSVTYTSICTIAASATGTLANTATVATPGGVTDPAPADNSSTDTDTLLTPQADLAITKSDSVPTAVPGGSTTYTIAASNAGPSDAPGATVKDTFPASLTCSSTCVSANGGTCTAGPIAGDINDTVDLPAGGSVTYTAVCAIDPAATGTLENDATVTAPGGVTDGNSANNSASDIDTLAPDSDLALTLDALPDPVTAGSSLSYSATITNDGPSTATGIAYQQVLPADTTFASITADPDFACTTPAMGASGTVDCTAASLAPATALEIVIVVDVDAAATGSIDASASVASTSADADTNNNGATVSTQVLAGADLSISIDNARNSVLAGDALVYSVQVDNNGPAAANGALVGVTLSAALAGVEWTCTPAPSAACPNASGTGNISETVNLAASEGLLYEIIATVSPQLGDPPSIGGNASIDSPLGLPDPDTLNNSATDIDPILPDGIFGDGFE